MGPFADPTADLCHQRVNIPLGKNWADSGTRLPPWPTIDNNTEALLSYVIVSRDGDVKPAPPLQNEREELLDKIITIGKRFHAKTAREAAEMMRARALTDAEWSTFGPELEARWDEWG